MTRETVLSELLNQHEFQHPNSLLLKKYILAIHNGWFRINGSFPDNQYNLVDYLFDNERIVFDFTRLSSAAKERFYNWFINPHQDQAFRAFLSDMATNEYRGYTAEEGLTWWGRVTNQLFYKKKSYLWNLAPLELTLDYQLNGIEICEGENGLLIGLQQFGVDSYEDKYHELDDNQEEPLSNTKRLFLTDKMVNELINTDLNTVNYEQILESPHPYATPVILANKRFEAMREYRKTQRLVVSQPWYLRLWRWIKSKFTEPANEIELQEFKFGDKNFKPLVQKDKVQVYQRPNNGEILIVEKRPELDTMVFCGGGAKIYAHVGAYRAFEEANIIATRFAGSSAGAIMALLCYLGYSANEILLFFQEIREENIIHWDLDSSGISDTRALKAALDFMIIKKVTAIIEKYNLEKTDEGRSFLANKVFKNNKISFESLQAIKSHFPDCGFGESLIVTATMVKKNRTRYFSYTETPSTEVSAAVTMSASFPVVFKPTLFEGELHNDGGILSNLPTEVFHDDHSTFLESDYGNYLNLVAFQFDNGQERGILDKFVHRVYRENFILNWIYGLLTGVKDPVSGWEKDRLKLLHYGHQVVLIPVGEVSSTQFDINEKVRNALFKNGQKAARTYIDTRYQCQEGQAAVNEEYMHTTFSSIDEALYYCCYRNREDWFECLAVQALNLGMEPNKVEELRRRHFPLLKEEQSKDLIEDTVIMEEPGIIEKTDFVNNLYSFKIIYPLFLKLPCEFIKDSFDLKLYKAARHAISMDMPLAGVHLLKKIGGQTHILIPVLVNLLKDLAENSSHKTLIYSKLELINTLLNDPDKLNHPGFYGCWHLNERQLNRVLENMKRRQWQALRTLCDALKINAEPMQVIVRKDKDALDKEMLQSSASDLSKDPNDYWYIKQSLEPKPCLPCPI